MPLNKVEKYAKKLWREYSKFRFGEFPSRHFSQHDMIMVIWEMFLNSDGMMTHTGVGRSFEDRMISTYTMGRGPTRILLWSQMHGDESTATMAMFDIMSYFLRNRRSPEVQTILSKLTFVFLPMLNPDGAQRTQRRTAQSIDMNRDAEALRTPEARLLKSLQRKLRPEFGFNLHDQELSTVASSKVVTAIAVLAPAFDVNKSTNAVRTRAKHLTATFSTIVERFAPGRVGRYDDTFEPRAFGDNMQKWGTSTMLIESGHALNDPQKNSIRKLNAVGMLATFYTLATGEYASSKIERYESLPFNGKRVYDVVIRNVQIDYGKGKLTRADLGVSYQVDTHSENPPKLVDLGDLHTFIGMKEVNAKGKRISAKNLVLGKKFEWEKYF